MSNQGASSALEGAQTPATGAVPIESVSPAMLEQLLLALQQEAEQLAGALQQLNFASQRWALCKQSIEEFEGRFSFPRDTQGGGEEVANAASVASVDPLTSDLSASVTANSKQRNQILVPLSGSLFVLGRIKNPDRCLIDIGTGYHAERSLPDARGFFEKRLALIRENIRRLTSTLDEKQGHMETVRQVLMHKMAALQQSKDKG
jgi:prefoldin alpha subunit